MNVDRRYSPGESLGIYAILSKTIRKFTAFKLLLGNPLFVRFCGASLLYFVAVAIRLIGISQPALQGDEFLWLERSEILVSQLEQGNYSNATTHLKHPGVPPAFILGIAQRIGNYYNERRGLGEDAIQYIRPETSARSSNAIVSSLCAPTIYLFAASFFGAPAAFLGGALVAFSPHHIELSRVVHLDGMFSFFVTITILLFAHAVRAGSLSLKLLAGIAWGFCIATKPTSASLILAFLLYKAFRHWFLDAKINRGDRGFFAWSDVAAVLIAHLLLACIYTRLWEHGSTKLGRFLLSSWVADSAFALGSFLQENVLLSLTVVATLALLAAFSVLAVRRDRSQTLWAPTQRSIFYLCCIVLVTYLALAPQIVENTIRYWTFAVGLAHEVHMGGWGVWRPPAYGYAEFFVRKLPSFALLGVFISFGYLLRDVAKRRKKSDGERVCFHLLCFLAVTIWVIPLNTTSKQDFRYAIPIVPILYLCVSVGFFRLWRSLAFYFARSQRPQLSRVTVFASPGLIMLAALGVVVSTYPHYNLHFSMISGGLKSAKEHQIKFPLAAHREALEFLHRRAEAQRVEFNVLTVGEIPGALPHTYNAMYRDSAKFLKFPAYFYPTRYDYIVEFGSYPQSLKDLVHMFRPSGGIREVFSTSWKGVELLRVHEVQVPDFREAYRCSGTWGSNLTGGPRHLENTRRVAKQTENSSMAMFVGESRHKPGFLLADMRTRVAKGRYKVQFEVARPLTMEPKPEFGDERYAVRLDFGKCQRIVTKGELSREEFRWVSMECEVEEDSSRIIQAYWFGNIPTILRSIEIQRIPND